MSQRCTIMRDIIILHCPSWVRGWQIYGFWNEQRTGKRQRTPIGEQDKILGRKSETFIPNRSNQAIVQKHFAQPVRLAGMICATPMVQEWSVEFEDWTTFNLYGEPWGYQPKLHYVYFVLTGGPLHFCLARKFVKQNFLLNSFIKIGPWWRRVVCLRYSTKWRSGNKYCIANSSVFIQARSVRSRKPWILFFQFWFSLERRF